MLKRKIEKQLLSWKNSKERNPLILKGCRQCGKTWSVNAFAKEQYKNVVYLNFFENPNYKEIFSATLEVDHLTMMMSVFLGPEISFEANETRAMEKGRLPYRWDMKVSWKCILWILKSFYGQMGLAKRLSLCFKAICKEKKKFRKLYTKDCESYYFNILLWEECPTLSKTLWIPSK